MSNGKETFEARIARLAEAQSEAPAGQSQPLRRSKLGGGMGSLRLVILVVSLAGMAAVAATAWPDLKQLYVADAKDPQRQGTYLERSILNNMTDAEIDRMNSDPRLEGKTQMQKLLLSH